MNTKGEEDEPREQVAIASCYAQHNGSARYNWGKNHAIAGGEQEMAKPKELCWKRHGECGGGMAALLEIFS